MYAFVKDRVTERQQRFIADFYDLPDSAIKTNTQQLWPFDVAWRADLLREIIPNPFRPIVRREGEFWRSNVAIPQWLWEEKPPDSIEFDPAWLTWNNGTVGNLIRAMMEEECDDCPVEPDFPLNHSVDCVCEHPHCPGVYLKQCETCHGKGYAPRVEPQWEMMPILGDALESAGCTEAEILDHLRGTEPCPHCDGEGARFYDEDDRLQCKQRCDDCDGTGKRLVRHCVGCWVVELLMGGM